ncbi:MAG: hypothetical protein R2712_30380 [Vicinamibacterales bacterium]
MIRVLMIAGLASALAGAASGGRDAGAAVAVATAQTPVNHDAKVMQDFSKRAREHVQLRERVERDVPARSSDASAEAIAAHRHALVEDLAAARANAQPGDLFGPEIAAVVRKLIDGLFERSDAPRALEAGISEEDTAAVPLAVNTPYPDDIPVSTMPPSLLRHLPPLPDGLEYRFVGNALILLDSRAHLIVDYVPRALPK